MKSQSMFPHFVIGLVLPLLLLTPTIWFSLDHKRNVSNGIVSRIRMLFSPDHKLYVSDYDSDSDSDSNSDSDAIASETSLKDSASTHIIRWSMIAICHDHSVRVDCIYFNSLGYIHSQVHHKRGEGQFERSNI